jgi:cyclic pyranopterin phosphate synthase
MRRLSHIGDDGAARMVDVSDKAVTTREATAEATVVLSPEAYAAAKSGNAPKGDVLGPARIAGIMAAKRTSDLIPLCHPLPLSKADVDFEWLDARHALRVTALVRTDARTGVEMEALTAVSVAALTVYDMLKALGQDIVIENVRVLTKSGGGSGPYQAPPQAKTAGAHPRPKILMSETSAPRIDPNAQREAFRAFMTSRRLRASEWAKQAGVPVAQIYGYLTGRSRALGGDAAERLARAAHVRVEDLFK